MPVFQAAAAAIAKLSLAEAISIGATVTSTVGQQVSAKQAAEETEEAKKIETNQEKYRSRVERRKLAREERRRRADLRASAESTGTQGSSGEIGAAGAIGTNFGQEVAGQTAGSRFAISASNRRQSAANAQSRGQFYQSLGTFGGAFSDFLDEYNK